MTIHHAYDSMPEQEGEGSESRNVLVYDTGSGWIVGFYCHEFEMWCSFPDGNELFDPTQWQELPEPPK